MSKFKKGDIVVSTLNDNWGKIIYIHKNRICTLEVKRKGWDMSIQWEGHIDDLVLKSELENNKLIKSWVMGEIIDLKEACRDYKPGETSPKLRLHALEVFQYFERLEAKVIKVENQENNIKLGDFAVIS